jgi:hypothetical protein
VIESDRCPNAFADVASVSEGSVQQVVRPQSRLAQGDGRCPPFWYTLLWQIEWLEASLELGEKRPELHEFLERATAGGVATPATPRAGEKV